MGLTIRDVAREAGVSTATVSRALRGHDNVDPATSERIREVARRLDYVISPAASRLASGRTGTVAVLIPYISRWYFASVLAGVAEVLQENDIDCLLHSVPNPDVASIDLTDRRLRRRVDGVVVLGLQSSNPDVSHLLKKGFQLALVGTEAETVSSVLIDDYEGASVATRHLVNLGHRRIGLIAGDEGPFLVERHRTEAFRSVLQEAGLEAPPELVVPGYFTAAGGEAAMNALLALRRRPSAVFAMSDEMAFGAMRALRRHGLRAGEDLSIMGFDGHDMADLFDLTTITQPVRDLGSVGARFLLAQIADPLQVQHVVLPTELSVRGSTATA